MRIIAHLAEVIDSHHFTERWKAAANKSELREILLCDERFINIKVDENTQTRKLIGNRIKDIDLPGETLIAILKRAEEITIPHGDTMLEKGDELSVIGDPDDIEVIDHWRTNGAQP